MYFLNTYVDKLWRGENVKVEAKEDGGANFAWSTLEELGDYLSDKKLLRRLRTFIVDYWTFYPRPFSLYIIAFFSLYRTVCEC